MEWLNYHHLLYFWMVAREGTVARASDELRLAPQTVSGQIHQLESALGERLFARRGRYLVLTEVGRVAFRYADEMFSLGRELLHTLKGRPSDRPMRLIIGVADVLPKGVVRRLLDPATRGGQPLRIVCREDKSVDEFVGELAAHKLDLVLADAPVGPGVPVRAFSHLLGECGTSFLRLAAACRRPSPPLSPLARRRAASCPGRQLHAATGLRPVAVLAGAPSDGGRRVRRFGADERVRPRRERHVPRPVGHRKRGLPAPWRPGRRPRQGASPPLLRRIGRAQAQAPRGDRDLRAGPEGLVRLKARAAASRLPARSSPHRAFAARSKPHGAKLG